MDNFYGKRLKLIKIILVEVRLIQSRKSYIYKSSNTSAILGKLTCFLGIAKNIHVHVNILYARIKINTI